MLTTRQMGAGALGALAIAAALSRRRAAAREPLINLPIRHPGASRDPVPSAQIIDGQSAGYTRAIHGARPAGRLWRSRLQSCKRSPDIASRFRDDEQNQRFPGGHAGHVEHEDDDSGRSGHAAVVEAARRLNRASGIIATSTLLDSAVEHYRGNFHNKAMLTPLVASALAIAVSVHGTGDQRKVAHKVRNPIYLGAAVTGLVGTGFHIYNIMKRPGGFSWQNLFYGSPLGAPAAVALSGLLGYYSERLRDSEASRPRVFGFRAGRALAALAGIGMLATSAEAGLLHFRGAYHDPFMLVPVTVPPIAAALLAETATSHPRPVRGFTRWWLRLTALVGCVGAAFHAWGVHRNMGGWRNWRQNVLNGPPIPAPPSFTGLALAGLAALELLRKHHDA